MKVALYVMNDLVRDSRVIREAQTLGAAGHQVTVVATTEPGQASGTRVQRDGYDVVHVAIQRHWPFWYVWLKHPWRLRARVARSVGTAFRRPAAIPSAIVVLAAAVLSIPWVVIRGGWWLAAHRLLGRRDEPGVLDYVLRWRAFNLGWDRAAAAVVERADVHHASDMETLPAAIRGASQDGGLVVYDSHEVYLEFGVHARQPRWLRAIMAHWERSMTSRAAAVVTVNAECAEILQQRLHPRRIVVVHNCPPRWDPPTIPADLLRRAAGLAADEPIVLCHGGFQAGRGIEQTIGALAMPGLERARLVFLGYRTAFLDPLIAASPASDRIHVLPAVSPDEVLAWVAGADVDMMVFQPTELNNVVSTPNKLFESLAAGVPVVSSDFPIRRKIVLEDPDGPLGAVCDPTEPRAIAQAAASILDLPPAERADLRARCLQAAHERWNWETESRKLIDLYASLDRAGS